MKYLTSVILLLCLAIPAQAETYKFISRSFSTYGWGMNDTDALDREKQKIFNECSALGEVVDIQETPHMVSGTVTMYTYTIKLRVENVQIPPATAP